MKVNRSTLLLLLLLLPAPLRADITIQDQRENELHIEVMESDGDLLTLWISDLVDEQRPPLRALFDTLQQNNIEVWNNRLLEDLFLTRSDASILSLDGAGIAALIEAAHRHSDKQILLVSYDKMSIALLRGIRYWQQHYPNRNRISGAVLLYPNLFLAPSRAGEEATPVPILSRTNIPLILFQPEQGQHAKRITQAMEKLWDAGAAATLIRLPDVRDWYIMHEPGRYPAEAPVRKALPHQLKQLDRQMRRTPFPDAPLAMTEATAEVPHSSPYQLIELPEPVAASDFTLADQTGEAIRLSSLQGQVVLLNFWASWCRPCVEELPSMNRLYQQFGKAGLEILALNFQEREEDIQRFREKVQIDFPVLYDHNGAVAEKWNVFGMPTSFLLDRSGQVRYSLSGSIYWDQPESVAIIEQLIAEP